MSRKLAVPDAWDDDWESQADVSHDVTLDRVLHSHVRVIKKLCSGMRGVPRKPIVTDTARLFQKVEATGAADESVVGGTKQERLAKHAERNKKLWESAELPETFHFLAAKGDDVPLKTEFKPTVKVLSRKPAAKMVSRHDPESGMMRMSLEDDGLDDEETAAKKLVLSPEEQRVKTLREREEKQRRYEEVRERLFGEQVAGVSVSGSSSPGNVTPPVSSGDSIAGDGKGSGTGRGRGKGGQGRVGPHSRPNSTSSCTGESSASASRRGKQGTGRGVATGEQTRQLYDPNDSAPRQASIRISRRELDSSRSPSRASMTEKAQQPIRTPRGPDGSGRGGHGFGGRGSTTVAP